MENKNQLSEDALGEKVTIIVPSATPVSYTHLTLPTIYSV